jgi:hypothetical protein
MCISEYAPSIELLFSSNEVPTFKTIDECEQKLRLYLTNEKLRNEVIENLKNKCDYFEDSVIMNNLSLEVENVKDLQTLNFKYNLYYKNYISRFKIVNTALTKPTIFFKEINYLFVNNFFWLSASSIKFIFLSIASRLKNKFSLKIK